MLFLLTGTAMAQKVRPIKVNASNAAAYRDSLKLLMFGSVSFPYDILPIGIETNVNTIDHFPGFPYGPIMYPAGNLDSVDRISIQVDPNTINFPQPVRAFLFHPHNSNGKLFIYHSGHCAGSATAEDVFANGNGNDAAGVIPSLVADGYTVLAVPMINYLFPYPGNYSCGYNNHDYLFIDSVYANPLGLFFKPLIASLNFLGRSNYSGIYMCGLSGGGWTTSLYQAIDTSVTYSFPVAGSWPMPVRTAFYPAIGDFEQSYPALYSRLLDYHELYTLACLAPARKMLQINNRYDDCCFSGSEPHIFYVDSVAKALRGSGGVFRFYLDETQTGHQISERALEVMRTFLANDTAYLQILPPDSITNGFDYLYDIAANFRLTTPPDNSALQFSLLKGPSWLTLSNGRLSGVVPGGNIFTAADSISLKVEDSTGRFVIHNFNLARKRSSPYFFTGSVADSTIYFLPPYRTSLSTVAQQASQYFFFNDPGVQVQELSVVNNSLIKMKINREVRTSDLVGYTGNGGVYALTYNNGLRLDDFGLTPIDLNVIVQKHAAIGMIRFNSDTRKFEYFNGTGWINMN